MSFFVIFLPIGNFSLPVIGDPPGTGNPRTKPSPDCIAYTYTNCRLRDKEGMSTPQLSEAEILSSHCVAKLTRLLRMQGFINSTPGYKGGYILEKPAKKININKVLKALGGSLFDKSFCGLHAGALKLCTNSVDCSSRSLWQMVQFRIDQLLDQVTLHDLLNSEKESGEILNQLLEQNVAGI